MPLLLLGVLWFVALMVLITLFGYRYWVKPATFMDRVGTRTADTVGDLDLEAEGEPAGVTRVIRRVGEAVPASPETMRTKRRRLIAAGYRSESAVAVMYGIQIAAAVVVGLASGVLLRTFGDFTPEAAFAIALLLAAGGFQLPNEILRLLTQRRRRNLRHALPDGLDLLVICVESGLGLDQALQEVSRELHLTHPVLSEEIGLVTLELRAGKRRSDALRNLAERTGEAEFRKLVAILIQTDRFGTSVAQALRTHSDFMRVQRRQVAEEKANKVGVKLVFPIFFFILPAMFLVTVGPALLHLIFEFFPIIQQMG